MKKRHLIYSPHLITYIDILGFRELVEKKDPNFISKAIREVLEVTRPSVHTQKFKKENYVNFSDLIVHTVPFVDNSDKWKAYEILVSRVKYIALVQTVLIERGLLLRGAITVGNMERTYGVLFGPGLISAYELERDQALFPRIIVDPGLLETLEENQLFDMMNRRQLMRQLSKCLKRDDDGLVFVDYLGFMGHVLGNDRGAFLNLVAKHKKLIDRNLRRFARNKKVLSKYLWLRKYHNAVIWTKFRNKHSKFYIDMPGDSIPVSPLAPGSN